MRGRQPLFSSDSADWRTPQPLVQAIIDQDLGGYWFDCDFAASATSTWSPQRYFGPDNRFPEYRSLWDAPIPPTLPLRGTGWLNPPFRAKNPELALPEIKIEWSLRRAVELSGHYDADYSWTIYALIPARTDTRWWWSLVWPVCAEIRLIPGRLKFVDPKTGKPRAGAPFPSALVIYRPGYAGQPMVRKWDCPR